MRLNKYLATNTALSRRKADEEILRGSVFINGIKAELGQTIKDGDLVTYNDKEIIPNKKTATTLLLNKPVGYVCSKDGQGSPTVYELIPEQYRDLNIAGRLDKDSSGLVVMTDDGVLLNDLTHPSNNKEKIYEVILNRELSDTELEKLSSGIDIGDERPSKFKSIKKTNPDSYEIILEEGRNRQIRRTLEKLNVDVVTLHRNRLGPYELRNLATKTFAKI